MMMASTIVDPKLLKTIPGTNHVIILNISPLSTIRNNPSVKIVIGMDKTTRIGRNKPLRTPKTSAPTTATPKLATNN